MANRFTEMLQRMAAEAASAQILQSLFSGTSLGASLGMSLGMGGGGFAMPSGLGVPTGGGTMDTGGRGYPGKAYTIGTKAQPEMFVPDQPGTFVPAGGSNVTVEFEVHNYAGAQVETQRQQTAGADGQMTERFIISVFERDVASNGPGIRSIQRALGASRVPERR